MSDNRSSQRDLMRKRMEQLERAVDAMLRNQPVMMAPDPEMGDLLQLAGDLRYMPREEFLKKLKRNLGGAMTTATQPVRAGFRTVTPYLTVPRAPEQVEFMKNAFGAEETFRTIGSAGGFHIEVKIGDSMLMVGGGGETYKGPYKAPSLHLFVEDEGAVDRTYEKALASGAKSLYAPKNQPYRVRDCGVEDFTGTQWFISSPMRDEAGREIEGLGTVTAYLRPAGADRAIEFMKRAFGAEVLEAHRQPEDSGPIVHAKMKIVDSVIELGEARDEWQNMPTMFFLYVDEPEAWYERAMKAGAKSLFPVSDQPYGRAGAVEDEWGNAWYVSTARE